MKQYKKDCIFCKIAEKEVKADIVYEDEKCIVFSDVNPQAPVHLLVVPRNHIENLNGVGKDISAHLIAVARRIAEKKEISKNGWRLVVNCGRDGGQTVGHLHFHILGGRQMKWPPG